MGILFLHVSKEKTCKIFYLFGISFLPQVINTSDKDFIYDLEPPPACQSLTPVLSGGGRSSCVNCWRASTQRKALQPGAGLTGQGGSRDKVGGGRGGGCMCHPPGACWP